MDLNQYFEYTDSKFDPMIMFLFVSPLSEIKEILSAIELKHGIMRDFCGFEFEENDTLTFFDFSSTQEKSINLSIQEFILFFEPLLNQYLIEYPNEKTVIEALIKKHPTFIEMKLTRSANKHL
jgi:hypothetical protein